MSRPAVGVRQPHLLRVPGSFPGLIPRGAWCWPHTTIWGSEWVELYLHSYLPSWCGQGQLHLGRVRRPSWFLSSIRGVYFLTRWTTASLSRRASVRGVQNPEGYTGRLQMIPLVLCSVKQVLGLWTFVLRIFGVCLFLRLYNKMR